MTWFSVDIGSATRTHLHLEFPRPEGGYIQRSEFEPFAVGAAIGKPTMPVSLDAGGIIGTDRVDQFCLLGQGNADFLHAPFQRFAAPDLVESARPDRINKSFCRLGRRMELKNGSVLVGPHSRNI
nr:hypothetical protein [Sphingomonas formosensis]